MEPEIAPLAKRLAEENNVNWRALSGSGANGRILERDVLEYLARVMAGEEDLNPTSEPLPEGMDAWPEDDVKSYYGVDTSSETPAFASDIDDASLFVDAAESTPVEPTLIEPTLGEDIFLVDEEDVSVQALSHEPVVYDASLDNLEDDISDVYGALTLDDVGVDDVGVEASSDAEVIEVEAFAEEPVMETFEEIEPVESDLSERVNVLVPEQLHSPEEFSDTAALFVEDAAPVEEAFAALSSEPLDTSFETPIEEVTDFEAPVAVSFSEPVLEEIPAIEESYATTEVFAEPEIISASYDAVAPDVEDVFVEPSLVQETFVDNPQVEAQETPVQNWQEEVAADTWSEPEPVPTPDLAPVATLAAGLALGGAGVSAPSLPLVTYGVLLRRHIDLSTLIQAQHAVAEELGREDPMVITSFLVRAAAKALHKVPLVQGSVGLASIREQGVGIASVPEASSASFRSILDKTHQALAASLQQEPVALAVADMSSFDIDEAVLNVGVPVLTLGRMMYDNTKGTHQSTLSISGNVSVESGTKFLSAVAELLNSPVRLVV